MTFDRPSVPQETTGVPPAFLRRDWWYLGGLVAVTFAYFWRAALGLGIFFHEDIHGLFYPLKALYADALRAGRLPMWNPYIGAGYPQFAEGQIAALYPLNPLLFGLLPLSLAFSHMIIWHFALAGVFFYLFLRKRGLGGPAAFIGASVFEWSGFMTAHLQHPSITCSVAWLPLLLYFLEDGRQRAQAGRSLWRPMLGGGAVVALQVLVAYPPVIFYSLLAGAIYILCAGMGVKRAALLWGGMLGAGLSVSAVQWIPTADLTLHSVRVTLTRLQYMTSFGFTPRQLPTLVFPHHLGSPAYGTYVGVMYFWEVCGYIGLLALPLAFWGATRRRRRGWPFVVIGAVGLALAFGPGNPIYQALQYVPVFNFFRAPGRYLLLWTIAGAALAAEGMEALLAQRTARSRVTLFFEAAVTILCAAGVVIPLVMMRTWPEIRHRPAVLPSEWLFLAVSLTLFGVLLAAARAGGSRRLLWVCSGMVMLADLLAFARPLAPVKPAASVYGRAPWTVRHITADLSWHRVWSWRTTEAGDPYYRQAWPWELGTAPYRWDEQRLMANTQIVWRLPAIQANAALMNDLLWNVHLTESDSYPEFHQGFGDLLPMAHLLGAKYIVLRHATPGLELIEKREKLLLYRNPQAMPRAWVVGAADAAVSPEAELREAMDTDFPLRERVVINAPPPILLTAPGEIRSEITFEDPRPEVMRLRTRTDAPGMLVVSQTYDPDWRVTVDGKAARLYRAQWLVQAVFLPSGEHTVEFRYDSLSYQVGLRLSLIMAAVWAGLAARAWSRRRQAGILS